MIVREGIDNLKENLLKQLSSFWNIYDEQVIIKCVEGAIERLSINMSEINTALFRTTRDDFGEVVFSPYNTCEYCVFLYYLSNLLYKEGNEKEAGLVYWLNKIMNQIELFYAIELPSHFWLEHPLGTVLGRAKYGDYLFFNQGVTVGGSEINSSKPTYPTIGSNVILCAGSKVLGESTIGDNVIVGSGAIIKNQDVPSNTVVFGESPNIIIKDRKDNRNTNSLWIIPNI